MNFLNSFLGSSGPPKMDSTVDTRRQLVAAMPPKSNASAQRATAVAAASVAADAAFLNSQLVGGTATSGAHNSSINQATTSHSFYRHEDRLLDPDFIDHLAEYSDTEEGPDDDWSNFGADDDDDAHLESGFTPENVFGPTEDDASSKATGSTSLTLHKPSDTIEAKIQYQATLAKPHVYNKPAPSRPPATRAAPQKRKSFILTDEEPTMYMPDDMITIEAYMGPPADICPPSTGNTSHRRNCKSEDYSDSESSEDSEDEDDTKKPAASSTCGDHTDPFSKLAESSVRTETTRRYLEESRRMYSSIPDFHRYSNTERAHSVPATNSTSSSSFLDDASEPNMNASFNSSGFNSNHNSATSFHNSFSSSTGTCTLTMPEIKPSSSEHQSRMSNLLTAMERTEQSRALLRRRSEAVTSASTVSASGITSLVMGRVGGPRKSRGASPPRSYQRLF